jgi:hypothetical protein
VDQFPERFWAASIARSIHSPTSSGPLLPASWPLFLTWVNLQAQDAPRIVRALEMYWSKVPARRGMSRRPPIAAGERFRVQGQGGPAFDGCSSVTVMVRSRTARHRGAEDRSTRKRSV